LPQQPLLAAMASAQHLCMSALTVAEAIWYENLLLEVAFRAAASLPQQPLSAAIASAQHLCISALTAAQAAWQAALSAQAALSPAEACMAVAPALSAQADLSPAEAWVAAAPAFLAAVVAGQGQGGNQGGQGQGHRQGGQDAFHDRCPFLPGLLARARVMGTDPLCHRLSGVCG